MPARRTGQNCVGTLGCIFSAFKILVGDQLSTFITVDDDLPCPVGILKNGCQQAAPVKHDKVPVFVFKPV